LVEKTWTPPGTVASSKKRGSLWAGDLWNKGEESTGKKKEKDGSHGRTRAKKNEVFS